MMTNIVISEPEIVTRYPLPVHILSRVTFLYSKLFDHLSLLLFILILCLTSCKDNDVDNVVPVGLKRAQNP